MKTVNVQFVNFWKGFKEQGYVFLELFQKRYHQNIVTDSPNLLFYADRIKQNPTPVPDCECVKVFYTGENTTPPTQFDYSFSFNPTTETNFQLPIFARCKYYFDFIQQDEQNKYQKAPKDNFCNFVYRNKKAQERQRFCEQLQTYRRVDCPGEVLNNMPNFARDGRKAIDWLSDKIEFISKYKFTIAFENEGARNYITEKLFDAFYVGSIPIYWGAPNVTEFFDPNSFINVRDFDSFDAVIERVKEINSNDELYEKMRSTPPIHETSRLKECTEEAILNRFDKIIKRIK